MNNYEKIKNMTVDEIAEWICKHHECEDCRFLNSRGDGCITYDNPWKQWLLSEVEE